MSLPTPSFKEFVKNPIVGLMFLALVAVGYLYIDNRTTLTNQISHLREEIKTLQTDYKELNNKFIENLEEENK